MNNKDRILFEIPDLEELTKQYTVFDMHFHSNYSDGMNTIHEIANRARYLDIGIAITDHNDIRGAVEMDSDKTVLSIPGIEITSKIGSHLLIYFYDIEDLKSFYYNDILPYMGKDVMSSLSLRLEEIIERARVFETVIIFPHPYSAVFTGICNYNFSNDELTHLFDIVDGVEVINSGNLNKWNLQCTVLGFNLDKAITGGSDGHTISHMGKVVNWARCPKDRKSFLDAIKNKQNKVVGKEINLIKKVTSNSRKIKSNFKNYHNSIGKNIKYGYTVFNSKSKRLKDNVKRTVGGKIKKKSPFF